MFQRKNGTAEDSTQRLLHAKSQNFLRRAKSSPRDDAFKSPSAAKRKSFKTLPAINDDYVGEDDQAKGVETSYGSVEQLERGANHTCSSTEAERELETKLRQMLERQSTKVRLPFQHIFIVSKSHSLSFQSMTIHTAK